MKKYLVLGLAALLAFAGVTSAQKKQDRGWKEKMNSEKIAFITTEVDLTPEEAQTFWPVYNVVCNDRDEAMKNIMVSYKALEESLDSGKSEEDIASLLEAYLKAQERQRAVENGAADQFKKVLSTEKLAKLYVAEEKFRRHHIRNMHNRPRPEGHPGRPEPGKRTKPMIPEDWE